MTNYGAWSSFKIDDEIAKTDAVAAAEYRIEQHAAFMKESHRMLDAWLGETWDNIPADEATEVRETLQEKNPAAWEWLLEHTLRAIMDYRKDLSKN